jgi:CRP/FNR family transcriptional regulator
MEDKQVETLKKFFKNYPLIKYKKGDIILKPEKNFGGIAFVKSGYAKMYTKSKKGKLLTLPVFKPIFFYSMVTNLMKRKSDHYIEAITPVELWIAPTSKVLEYMKKEKDLYAKMMTFINNEMIDLCFNISHYVFGDAKVKVSNILYTTASKYGVKGEKGLEIKFKIPHKMLASMLGLTRETVTLQILKMEKKGLLSKNGRNLVIKDLAKLKEAATL